MLLVITSDPRTPRLVHDRVSNKLNKNVLDLTTKHVKMYENKCIACKHTLLLNFPFNCL